MKKRSPKGVARKWMAENQGKHICQCGCGTVIKIAIQHHVRGIPRFAPYHAPKVLKQGATRIGALNGRYKGGRYIDKRGYVQVLTNNPKKKSRYEFEHRLIMQETVGRELSTNETVHHGNRRKAHNTKPNLKVIGRSPHSRLHALAGETGFRLLKRLGIKWFTTKLSESDVREIRKLAKQGVAVKQIAARFNVSGVHVRRIARGLERKDVRDAS